VLRSDTGLAAAAAQLAALLDEPGGEPSTDAWETTNLLTVACGLVDAARRRQETRGSHWREDFPERDDLHWAGHIDVALSDTGEGSSAVALQLGFRPAAELVAEHR